MVLTRVDELEKADSIERARAIDADAKSYRKPSNAAWPELTWTRDAHRSAAGTQSISELRYRGGI